MADTDKVEIVFAHHHGTHVPGERATVDADEARRLVRGGRANYATKTDAVSVEGEAGADKTARRRAKPTDA